MTNPVMVVHNLLTSDEKPAGKVCWVWCPGCNQAHRITVVGDDGSRDTIIWDWDGNVEQPTFDPSILCKVSELDTCHSYLKEGKWQFLSDSTHRLAGQTVDMIPLPNWIINESDAEFNEMYGEENLE